MLPSARHLATADQMLRLATAGVSEPERQGYIELARNWRLLADEALAHEVRVGATRENDPDSVPGAGGQPGS